ncbi:MAG: FecR domain-containing protein [Verrucomicrobia bacterium]|nr:FecR domain-containing protein [Verrucomicrobiota bacterium]
MSNIKRFFLELVSIVLLGGSSGWLGAQTSAAKPGSNLLLSMEGKVEVAEKGTEAWKPARLKQPLVYGDRVRTGAKSRAIIQLESRLLFRMNELTLVEIQPQKQASEKPTLDVARGAIYFFSRSKPDTMHLRTPVATGAIRGTEFNVTVADDGKTVLTLLEGEVALTNALGAVELKPGEQGTVQAGQAPAKSPVLDAAAIIQWALYYPGVLDAGDLQFNQSESESLRASLAAYRQGDLLAALAAYPAGRVAATDAEKVYFAALLLSVGRADEAELALGKIQSGDTAAVSARLARALRDMIAVVKGGADNAALSAAADNLLATELVVKSYQHQSKSHLDEALSAARHATEKSPEFGFAWARVAELEFSFGRVPAARAALAKAMQTSPRNAQAISLDGFLLSAQGRTAEALQRFEEAIAVDGALGNAWLGRGLNRIRLGQVQAGREDLQAAALLEPRRSLLRSYLGKALNEEGDVVRAAKELDLARKLDPNDPTPELYSALLSHQRNRINTAIRELERAKELNDNRSVFRSGLLLDQDRAVKSVNLAALYLDAGLTDVSLREASRAVNSDYANYSAHLFLANSYNELRDPNLVNLRYESAWFNELLLANLLAPVGAGVLSQTVSQQEYSRLFERDRVGIFSSTEYQSSGGWNQSGSIYGTHGTTGYAFDSFYKSRNGERPNDDQRLLTLSGQVKQQLTAQDSVLLQLIYADTQTGDNAQYYNQTSAATTLRAQAQQLPLLLAGYHREWQPGVHTLLFFGRFVDESQVNNAAQPVLLLAKNGAGAVTSISVPGVPTAEFSYASDLEIYSGELQQIWEREKHRVIFGGRFQAGQLDTTSALGAATATRIGTTTSTSLVFVITSPVGQNIISDFNRVSAYGYYDWKLHDSLQLNGGVSYDRLSFPSNHRSPPLSTTEDTREQVSPKAGLTWLPDRQSAVRFAYTRSLSGMSLDQSVRLEPSQMDGFVQTYRSLIPESVAGAAAGANFELFGFGVDRRFKTGTYLGVETELRLSGIDRTVGAVDLLTVFPFPFTASSTRQQLDYREESLTVTLNQLLGDYFTVGARYNVSRAVLDTLFPDIPTTVSTAAQTRQEAILHQLRLETRCSLPCGFYTSLEGLWNSQSNAGYTPALPGDDFWQFNAFVGHRFLKRRADVRVGVLNLTDRDYQLNPLSYQTVLPRERTVTVTLRLNF